MRPTMTSLRAGSLRDCLGRRALVAALVAALAGSAACRGAATRVERGQAERKATVRAQGRDASRPATIPVARGAKQTGPPSFEPPDELRTSALEGRVSLPRTGAGEADEGAQDGVGIAGATLSLRILLGDGSTPAGSASTSADGRYRFARIPPGGYVLVCRRAGSATEERVLWVEAGENTAEALLLRRAAPLGGVVHDEAGRAIAGARIQATSSASRRVLGGASATAATDANGRFELDGLSAGPHQVRVEADGYLASVATEVEAPSSDLDLSLVRLRRIAGSVKGPRDRVGGATVRLVGSGLWPGREVVSGAEGRFTFEAVPAGVYELVAQAAGDPPLASTILFGLEVDPRASAPATAVELELVAGQRIRGTVMDGDRPIAGAAIVLGPSALAVLKMRGSTDASGRFELGAVARGEYRLSVFARGYLPILDQATTVPVALPLALALTTGASVEGAVVDAQGSPIRGALARVVYLETASPSSGSGGAPPGELGIMTGPIPPIPKGRAPALLLDPDEQGDSSSVQGIEVTRSGALTDGAGRLRLSGLQPGRAHLIVDHPEFALAESRWFELRAGSRVSLETPIVLASATAVSGRVVDEQGFGVAGAEVAVLPGAFGGAEGKEVLSSGRITVSDRAGAFSFSGLAGTVDLTASKRGYAATSITLKLGSRPRQEVELTLGAARGRLRGRVQGPDRQGVAGATVAVARAGRRGLQARTDRAGGFELVGVGEAAVPVEVSHPSYQRLRATLDPAAEAELTLRYAATVEGVVQDSRTGAPLERCAVRVHGGEGTLSGRGGRFALHHLSSGSLVLEVTADGYARRSVTVTVPEPARPDEPAGSPIAITLERAGTIEGQLFDERGQTVAGAVVRAGGAAATSAADGHFRVSGVPEGSHVVEAALPGGRTLRSDSVVVRAGEVTMVRLSP
jgi:hypothetical protein